MSGLNKAWSACGTRAGHAGPLGRNMEIGYSKGIDWRWSWLACITAIVSILGLGWASGRLLLPNELRDGPDHTVYRAKVVGQGGGRSWPAGMKVLPLAGPHAGQAVNVSAPPGLSANDIEGRSVFIELREDGSAAFVGVARDRQLLWLTLIFLAITMLVLKGFWQPLVVLAAAVLALLTVFVPCLGLGVPPVQVACAAGTGFLCVSSLLISRGNKFGWGIWAGSMGGLLVAWMLSLVAISRVTTYIRWRRTGQPCISAPWGTGSGNTRLLRNDG